MATTKLFGVFDTISNRMHTVGLSTTAGSFVREIGKYLFKQNPNFEDEFVLVSLGELDEDHKTITSEWNTLSWDVYRRPEVPATPMTNADLASAALKGAD